MRKSSCAAQALLYSMLAVSFPLGGTQDVLFGPDAPSAAQWQSWFGAMNDARARTTSGIDLSTYADRTTAWSDGGFRQYFLFMYDQEFFRDGRYRTADLVNELRARYGRIDSVLLWHAYPQLGFDTRGQSDFYRQMPGGLDGLKLDVVDVFHSLGVRVFVDYNPWDAGSDASKYAALADVVASIGADGVMLDTMDEAPTEMKRAVAARRAGVVYAPEGRLADADLGVARQSWAQWFDLGPETTPSILRTRWLEPHHRQFFIRRWDTDRHGDIVYGFFNGAGMLIWPDVFGTVNPYSRADRVLLAETGTVIDAYGDFFSQGDWKPLVPTGVSGLDANRWDWGGRALYTFRNRTDSALRFALPQAPPGLAYTAFWPSEAGTPAGFISVPAHGTQALVLDDFTHAKAALAAFREASTRAAAVPDDARAPLPRQVAANPPTLATGPGESDLVPVPGGSFDMVITHAKRECGCYPFGADAQAQWGWFYKDTVTHRIAAEMAAFRMKRTQVTNADYLAFVNATGYRPADPARFLAQIPRTASGALPLSLREPLASRPVTFVDLDDARAYAHWKGATLPTEAQWQWAAQGTGLLGMSGSVWEWTESEYTDGHTRYAMLRGGDSLPPAQSEWMIPHGAHPATFHAKYFLMNGSIDRSEAIGFRVVGP